LDFTLDELNLSDDVGLSQHSGNTKKDFDPYKILEVSPGATSLQIREAYIRMKRTFQNNSQSMYSIMSAKDAQKGLNDLSRAYDILSGAISPADVSGAVKTTSFTVNSMQPEIDNDASKRNAEPTRKVIRTVARTRAVNVKDKDTKDLLMSLISSDDVSRGETLIALRKKAGLTVKDVSNHTKLSEMLIDEIESESFTSLPAAVYVRGYMKSFFKFLALGDQRAFIDGYIERMSSAKQ
jgi:hypothetical protein